MNNVLKECARLMFSPPIQFAAGREARAAREGRTATRAKWAAVSTALGEALRLALEAIDSEG